MYAPYLPTSASEFPNDNPELHDGARWVCPQPVSPPRAVLRASQADPAATSLQRALASSERPEWPNVEKLAWQSADRLESQREARLEPQREERLAPQWCAVLAPVRLLRPPAVASEQSHAGEWRADADPRRIDAEGRRVDAERPRVDERPLCQGESRQPFLLEPDAAPLSRPASAAPLAAGAVAESATPLPPGPLQLDLARIVLPHRAANVPPPPAFIFRPLPSSRRAEAARAIALASPPLTPLGYRVVDRRDAARRVQRCWRVDVAPCLAVAGSSLAVAREPELAPISEVRALPADAPVTPAAELIAAILADASAVPAANANPELEAAAVERIAAILTEAAALDDLPPPEGWLVPPLPEPPPVSPGPAPAQAGHGPASGRRRKPANESAPDAGGKKQRRRAVRVASSASLMTAALPGNQELSRTLSALEADFAERRVEQPGSARKRRARRASAASAARSKRAANAV